MKKRLFILLIAILAIVTGTKAATLELYDGQKWTDNIESVLKVLVDNRILETEKVGKNIVFLRKGKRLFGVEVDKLGNQTIRVPQTVIPSIDSFGALILGERYKVNFSVVINSTTFPDSKFRAYVKDFDTDTRLSPGRLTASECDAVKNIEVGSNGITSLKGVEYFTNLEMLRCSNNQLKELDVSKNTELYLLNCSLNQLSTLDVSKNTKLSMLYCSKNQIQGEGMATLINSLHESGGDLYVIDAQNEGNLIIPAQVLAATDKRWNVFMYDGSDWVAYDIWPLSIDEVNFPDAIFRAYVSNNCDTNGDGVLSKAEAEAVKEIYVRSKEITSLKGVEFFTKLEKLNCSVNPLKELDVTHNTELKELNCGGTWEDDNPNQLTSLDVSKNTALTHLGCTYNKLTSLDVSKNTALGHLSCNGNQLKKLDVTNNVELEGFYCDGNQLSTLDVSNNKKLVALGCGKNQLTAIDISNNPALIYLSCDGNQLSSLDVSNQPVLQSIYCDMNAINGKSMEMFIKSLPRLSGGWVRIIDLSSSDEQNVITRTQVLAAKEKGWKVADQNGDEYNGIIIAGDANGDGEVTAADVEAISDYILGRLAPDSWFDEESADVVDDGVVDILDLTKLIALIAPPFTLSCPDDHHPHAIDLGLSSGTKWACCNIGANKPGSCGDYFNWDVNTVQNAWGGNWQMPSKEQMQELIGNTTMEWTTLGGVNGLLVTGSNGGSMFLPAAGFCFSGTTNPSFVGTDGCYWTSTPDSGSNTWGLSFSKENIDYWNHSNTAGLPIRPVRK